MTALLITFRETLEAALVISIILTFLSKTGHTSFNKIVYRGIIFGISLSIILGIFLKQVLNGLSSGVEQIFEGILLLMTAGFLTWMILWIHKQKDVALKLRKKVSEHINKEYGIGIFFLVFLSIFREGTETVLYLTASTITGSENQLVGAIIGIFLAIIVSLSLFKFAVKINLSVLFNGTSIFLLLFAAGLVSHSVHEFQEIGILPIFSSDPILNVSHILSHKSVLGSFLRILFGYTSTPTFLEFVSYGSYIVFIVWLRRYTDRILIKY